VEFWAIANNDEMKGKPMLIICNKNQKNGTVMTKLDISNEFGIGSLDQFSIVECDLDQCCLNSPPQSPMQPTKQFLQLLNEGTYHQINFNRDQLASY
jgi:hypothetical protein